MRLINKLYIIIIVLLVCSCSAIKQVKSIPELKIEYGYGLDNPELNKSITYVGHGTASWRYKKGGIEADTPHPLENTYIMPKLDKTDKIKISISYPPDYYTVRYWTENYIGDPQTNNQYYKTLDINKGIIILPNEGLGHVFQVIATWESVNGIKDVQGYASYVFFVAGK